MALRRLASVALTFAATAVWLIIGVNSASALGAGDPAPSFSAPELNGGSDLSLAAYRGKVVYLDFWASWCPPCLVSLPLIENLRHEFPAADFQVLAINVDRDPEKARKFLLRNPVGYPSATDPDGKIPERFGIETMPSSFVIDRRGVIQHVHNGFRRGDIDPLRKQIAALLAGGR